MSIASRFEHQTISCPGCAHRLTVSLRKMRPGNKVVCTACEATIRFSGDDGAGAMRSLEELDEALRRFRRR